MSDYISRADAIEAVASTKPIVRSTERNWGKMIAEQHSKELVKALKALPSADAEPKRVLQGYCKGADCRWWNPQLKGCNRCVMIQDEYTHTSADAVPKWNCTANFVAEQLDRLRKMTDEEKWNFFREFFGMGDAVDENEDYVAVVRCKDCRFYWGNLGEDDTDEMYGECRWDSDEMPNADDFCSYGERRQP